MKYDIDFTGNVNECISCIKGKSHRLPFPNYSEHNSTAPLELIHSDICGPMSTETHDGKRYFVTFIDDYSRLTIVMLIKTKDEAMQYFIEFKRWAENTTGLKIKKLRTDGGGEYISKVFLNWLKGEGIEKQTTVRNASEQNGVAERMNRTLVEMGRSMMTECRASTQWWGESILTASYIRNRVPTQALLNKTPYEVFFGEKPSLQHLRTFGCKAFAHIDKSQRTKFDAKAVECRFIGYATNQKGYKLYNIATKKIFVARDVKFIETLDSIGPGEEMSSVLEESASHFVNESNLDMGSDVNENEIDESHLNMNTIENENEAKEIPNENENELRNKRSSGIWKANKFKIIPNDANLITKIANEYIAKESLNKLTEKNKLELNQIARDHKIAEVDLLKEIKKKLDDKINQPHYVHVTQAIQLMNNDPISRNEALNRADRKKWIEAEHEEMNSIKKNQT